MIKGEDFDPAAYPNLLLVDKAEIAANGEYNLSGERYRSTIAVNTDYPLVSLGNEELFDIVSGGTPSSKDEECWNGDVKWITLVDLPVSNFITEITDSERKISEKGLKTSSAKIVPPNSVIVSSRATIGRIGINKVPLATNQGFKNIIIKDYQKVLPKYLALTLTGLVDQMERLASGGTFKEISKTNFKTLQIPLPPLDVQAEIVAEIEAYQQEIENYKLKIEAKEEAIKKRIGKVWGDEPG
jgi:type I restriction enzyme M protein